MPVYKYDGPISNRFDIVAAKSDYYVTANDIHDAEYKIQRKASAQHKDRIFIVPSMIKEVESRWEKQKRLDKNPYENTCEECGAQLTDSGDCPVCDYGEEDYFDGSLLETIHKLNQLEE